MTSTAPRTRWRRRLAVPGCVALALALGLGAAAPSAQSAGGSSDLVRFQTWTTDSLALYGSYFRAFRADAPIALVLHDRGASSFALASLGYQLQSAGVAVFLPDLRGEGESVTSRRGNVPPAPRWDVNARALLARDLDAVLSLADSQPGLKSRPWVVVAEGEACALALDLLAADGGGDRESGKGRYAGALLLSPLPTADLRPGAAATSRPLMLVACDQDSLSLAAVRSLVAAGPEGSRRMELPPCRSRGVRALDGDPELPLRFLRWMEDLDVGH